jgi:3',5'-cyclic AMP phosphodiesterase CpdA
VKVAHATDIHWFAPPRVSDLTVRRTVGSANLYLMGRRKQFHTSVQQSLVDHVLALAPDLFVISGDLTAQALDSEFVLARAELQRVLDVVPTFIVPGNHDLYTPGAARVRRIHQHFEPWMHQQGVLHRYDDERSGGVTLLGLDPNRPTWFDASGIVPQDQLEALAEALADPALADRFVGLVLHYPIVDRRGALYDNASHGLRNARALVDVLASAPKKPGFVLHGHIHHGYRAQLPGLDIPSFDCGSSGQAWLPERGWGAAMNVYDIQDGALVGVERYLHDGERFLPEDGGAYATGR